MINRLGLVIHWIGFLCLTGSVALAAAMVIAKPNDIAWSEVLAIWELAIFHNPLDSPLSKILWAGIGHWPIKFVITGNKNLFPWSG